MMRSGWIDLREDEGELLEAGEEEARFGGWNEGGGCFSYISQYILVLHDVAGG